MLDLLGILAAWLAVMALLRWGWSALTDGLSRRDDDTFGSAQWMPAKAIRRSALITDDDAGVVLGRINGHTVRDTSEAHVLVCSSTRGGKTMSIAAPTLTEWPHHAVICDPKRELADLTAPWRQDHGSHIIVFDPLGRSSASINLLDSLRIDSPLALSDAELLARSLISSPGEERSEAHFYAEHGIMVLSRVLLYVAECLPDKTMAQALAYMTSAESPGRRIGHLLESSHPAVQSLAHQLLAMMKDERIYLQRWWASAVDGLSLWHDPTLVTHTATSDLPWDAFHTSDTPISLYIRSPEGQQRRLAPLIRGIAQIVLARRMEGIPERSLRKLLMLLDEFGSLGLCSPMVDALPRCAGYGVRVAFLIQDLGADILATYGTRNRIVPNCGTQLFSTLRELETLRYVSAMLGRTTVPVLSTRTGVSASFSNTSEQSGESLSVTGRELLQPDEVRRTLEHQWALFHGAADPILVDKIAWNDPHYAPRYGRSLA